ncbi:hypothetical protein [Rhizobium tubonense]|uniref:Transmembrane protein n=1 Tax=Rhizobium tubonense TaxID=484088 RepID=A0A2W4CQU4_9HYPH|nr:hypothetical protein [Rhizobium tubonense]PZM13238.1 hypothetical protein CPY51_16730 [Rhizobium tubonense]
MNRIAKRVVLHFPGFEPLDAAAHRARYGRSARQSASAWDYSAEMGELEDFGAAPYFDIRTKGEEWETHSRIHVLDHNEIVTRLNGRNLLVRLLTGYLAALRVAFGGGLVGYFRHAWRFGLFFIFPFLLILIGLLISLAIVLAPHVAGLPNWTLLLAVPIATAFFVYLFAPQAERLHTMHLFSDWELAVAMGGSNDASVERWIEACAASARKAFDEPADEYVVSSHSMGSSAAAHVIGLLLEREPDLFAGKRVVFSTLGSAILQCALLHSASVLRSRVGVIARCKQIFWTDVHCLTDAIHFYKAQVAALCGESEAPQATIVFIRFKTMLTEEHYRRIKMDFLRVHRQYVLGPDRRAAFDFTLMTAGPLPASDFAGFTQSKMPAL